VPSGARPVFQNLSPAESHPDQLIGLLRLDHRLSGLRTEGPVHNG